MRKILLLALSSMLAFVALTTRSPDARGDDTDRSPGTVTGSVVDQNDKPVAGMSLRLHDGTPPAPPAPPRRKPSFSIDDEFSNLANVEPVVATTTTDAQGKFTFPKVKPGDYLIRAGTRATGLIYKEVAVEGGKTVDVGAIKLIKN